MPEDCPHGSPSPCSPKPMLSPSPPPPPADDPPPAMVPPQSTSTNPLKRKDRSSEERQSRPTSSTNPNPLPVGAALQQGEYETGRVICEVCGSSISFRHEDTKEFTLDHWNAHRLTCAASASGPPATDTVLYTPESTAEALAHPPAKRRRAKRTEEERIEYLRADPYVGQFEAYRVLCASCDKWIRLRPNSTYCSIPWDAHRKSCLAKKINNKNVYALEERNSLFSKDPDVRKFDPERLLCNICDKWISVPPDDHLQAVQKWLQHRATCPKGAATSSSAIPAPQVESPAIPPLSASVPGDAHPSVAPASVHRASFSSTAGPSSPQPTSPNTPHPPRMHLGGGSPSSFYDLNPSNYAPAHESRRRNAEQRAATLRADRLIGEVEPNRVFCSLCQKWVQLRQDSSYCAYPWIQHRGKCLARHQRRSQKAAEMEQMKAARGKDGAGLEEDELLSERDRGGEPGVSDPDSEDGVESPPEDDRARRKEPRRTEPQCRSEDRYHYRPSSSSKHHHNHHHHGQQQQPHTGSHHQHPHPQPHPHHYQQPHPHHQKSRSVPYFSTPALAGHGRHLTGGGNPSASSSSGYRHDPSRSHYVSRPPRRWEEDMDVDADGDPDAEGEYLDEGPSAQPWPRGGITRSMPRRPWPAGLADLDSQPGRKQFIFNSVEYLFATTYESTDEMSISALLAYLNAAMPQDKHEDFDTSEVARAVAAMKEKGRVIFEGDILRLADRTS